MGLLWFLWWPEGHLNALQQEYKIAVYLFGATSFPSCAKFALERQLKTLRIECLLLQLNQFLKIFLCRWWSFVCVKWKLTVACGSKYDTTTLLHSTKWLDIAEPSFPPFLRQKKNRQQHPWLVLLVPGLRVKNIVFMFCEWQDRKKWLHQSTALCQPFPHAWRTSGSLRCYMFERELDLDTDHHALTWIRTVKNHNVQVTRWYLTHQPYKFVIRNKAGRHKMLAHFL